VQQVNQALCDPIIRKCLSFGTYVRDQSTLEAIVGTNCSTISLPCSMHKDPVRERAKVMPMQGDTGHANACMGDDE
jgi:hypothetical protein